MNDPELADMNLVHDPEEEKVSVWGILVFVRPWSTEEDEGDDLLVDGGFDTGTVACDIMPGLDHAGYEAANRVVGSILRLVPGDVCLTQDGGPPYLLRLGDTVYIDTYGYLPEDLTRFYTPGRLVIGIPQRTW